ncbi:MAG: acetyl-CoA carboxylase biotin carboxyl carrier protein [Spirochaetaceae bacterium]
MELKELFDLIDKFESSSLSEFRYEQAEEKVVLKRESEQKESSLPYYTQPVMVQPHAAAPSAAVPAGGAAPAESGALAENSGAERAPGVEQITSPIVGTFYRSASPDSPPFVHEGDVVESGQTLCILEAMKVMNELEAEFNMEVVAILAKNGDMVDFGSPLFEVRRV